MNQIDENLFCNDLPSKPKPEIGTILVTGATGYIGGRLVPELLAREYRVRVMVRSASSVAERWTDVEIVVADALKPDTLDLALKGVHTAYYLIHSLMLGKKNFETADIQAAVNFRDAANRQQLKRIIYLGGLGDMETPLSPHLRSRMRVAHELKRGKVPTTIFRAAVIIGSGSASYEIIKHLVRNVPILTIPKWACTKCQPISIRGVIKYLVGALEVDATAGKLFDIGGDEILTYEQMLRIQAEIMGKKRFFISTSLMNIGLYSYVASLLTPVPVPLVRCLMTSCKNDVVCDDEDIKKFLPFKTLSYREAILRAMSREEQDDIRTRWSDAYPPAHELAMKLHEVKEAIRFTSSYTLETDKSRSSLFRTICQIGGKEGWFNSSILWRMRGLLDRVLMGVGTSRGRRSTKQLRINDVIDFWRVEELVKNELLLLRAEMKLPGKAWLKFTVSPTLDNNNLLTVNAYYQPRNLFGKIYWYVFLPFHIFIFNDLIKEIAKRS
ncbi:SDR family oxidoreductase [candidate division KSB1 bacterium]|nr:SDR family oxidoreductase [candidate division KSB1 bacterium]